MPRKCSICKHPKRAHINQAIVSGKKSLRVISKQYEVSYSAVQRHKNEHLIAAMQLANKENELKEGKTAFEQFNDMVKTAEEKFNNSSGSLQVSWFREWRGMMELGFKLGMEAQREKREDRDISPAIKAIIDKEF